MQSDSRASRSTPTTSNLVGLARYLDIVGPNIGHGGAGVVAVIACGETAATRGSSQFYSFHSLIFSREVFLSTDFSLVTIFLVLSSMSLIPLEGGRLTYKLSVS